MPLKLNRNDRKLLAVAGVVFILLITGALLFSSGQDSKTEIPTTYSTASSGAKAAYLLLRESGYKESRWEKPLSDLPDPSGQILVQLIPIRRLPPRTASACANSSPMGGMSSLQD